MLIEFHYYEYMAKKSFAGVSNDIKLHNNHPILSFIIGIMALGILVAAGMFVYLQYQTYLDDQPTNTFTVTGNAEKDLTADEATLRFYLRETGDDVPALNAALDAKIEEIKTYLTDSMIPSNQIQINKNSYQDYYWNREGEEETPKQVVQGEFQVTIKNLEEQNTNDIISQLVERGVKDIQPLQYELTNQELECEALVDIAIEDATAKAEKRLKAVGGDEIVRKSIQEDYGCGGNYGYPIFFAESAADTASSEPAPDVLQGQEKLSTSVSMVVEYR